MQKHSDGHTVNFVFTVKLHFCLYNSYVLGVLQGQGRTFCSKQYQSTLILPSFYCRLSEIRKYCYTFIKAS